MQALIETIEYIDEGRVIAQRISDEWYLFISDFDLTRYYVRPDLVIFNQ